MMYSLGWSNWLRLIVWLAIGQVIYFTYSRHRSHLALKSAAPAGPRR
jgi:APA family basic amino acid/polyamine antiporter